MSLGLVGRKIGMTRLFTDDGDAVPVTVVDVSNNRVTQIKTPETDGYAAVQVAFGKRRASRVSKPLAGHLAKAAVEAGHVFRLARKLQSLRRRFATYARAADEGLPRIMGVAARGMRQRRHSAEAFLLGKLGRMVRALSPR